MVDGSAKSIGVFPRNPNCCSFIFNPDERYGSCSCLVDVFNPEGEEKILRSASFKETGDKIRSVLRSGARRLTSVRWCTSCTRVQAMYYYIVSVHWQ
jgi:hypothetical protein